MSAFAPKGYQARVLDSVRKYFDACNALGNANTAFYQLTGELWGRHQPFSPLPGFAPDMPYFCLRVPTGGFARSVVTFDEKINDGAADFDAGDYIYEYNVTVDKP